MIGEKLVLVEHQRELVQPVLPLVRARLDANRDPIAVAISGESGAGKSGLAHALIAELQAQDVDCALLMQDDYYHLPPKSNHARRQEDISWVGPGEVNLALLDEHVAHLKSRDGHPLVKPLVYFEENRIETEQLAPFQGQVIVVEGTYTLLLEQADIRVFLPADYHATRAHRRLRARDPDSDFLERVLAIEHREIAALKARADLVIEAMPRPAGSPAASEG